MMSEFLSGVSPAIVFHTRNTSVDFLLSLPCYVDFWHHDEIKHVSVYRRVWDSLWQTVTSESWTHNQHEDFSLKFQKCVCDKKNKVSFVFREHELCAPEMSEVELLSFYTWKEKPSSLISMQEVQTRSQRFAGLIWSGQQTLWRLFTIDLKIYVLHFLRVTVPAVWSSRLTEAAKQRNTSVLLKICMFFWSLGLKSGENLGCELNAASHQWRDFKKTHELNSSTGAIWFTFKVFFTNILTGMLH